jgi:hypothetical protein
VSLLLRYPLLGLTLFALAVRAWTFGNPVIHVDDQFYMLVGQRMWEGALPYVDIWDRKPIGLFLIYALTSALPVGPVLGYQLAATLCVIGTAWLIWRMARDLAGPVAALAGAMTYVAWLPLFGGIGGQSPVFYNLLVVLAVWLTLPLVTGESAALTGRGCTIMLIVGAAMQIKYSALFEGMFLGLTLLWLGWRSEGSLPRLAGDGALWVAFALLPTALAWGWYAAMGHGDAFYQANFVSVFQDALSRSEAFWRLFWQMLGLLPFWLCLGIVWRQHASLSPQERWLIGWAMAALGGYLAFGNWFDHYVLPMLVPLSVIAAMAFARIRHQRLAMALVVGLGLAAGVSRAAVDMADRGYSAEVAALAAMVEQHRGDGCLYVTEDITALYMLTNACLPTRYIMPDHLGLARFRKALGADQAAEMGRLLGSRPAVIVYMNDPEAGYAPDTRTMLHAALRDHYVKVGEQQTGAKLFSIYSLRP